MDAKTICNADLLTFDHVKTDFFDVGVYAQKSPLKSGRNEDSIGYALHDKLAFFGLADGVGGSPNGDIASSKLIYALVECTKKKAARNLLTLRHALLTAIEKSNSTLVNTVVGARTTLSACIIDRNRLQCLQIGDSNVLVCGQKGLLKYKTQEHSPVGFAVAAGLLSEQEALIHPERHLISNVVGDMMMQIDLGPQLELAENDTVLLASDGLFDNFLTVELIELIRKDPLEHVLQKLTALCQPMRNSTTQEAFKKIDDVSFIVCRKRHDKI